jgi:hypothetical protein
VREVEEEERLHPMTEEELEREDEELRRYGAAQAKKLGIKSDKDIERIIQEHCKRHRHASRACYNVLVSVFTRPCGRVAPLWWATQAQHYRLLLSPLSSAKLRAFSAKIFSGRNPASSAA